jgi:tetratricopeptide (TPR) repeat protein
LVQVGAQSLADRYTYIPLIGVFIILVWGVRDLTARLPQERFIRIALISSALAACLLLSVVQLRFWSDSVRLFEHALAVTPENATVRFNLAYSLRNQGRLTEALPHFQAGLRRAPQTFWVYADMAAILASQGNVAGAITNYRRDLELRPGQPAIHWQLGSLLLAQNRSGEAIEQYRDALRLAPDLVAALNDLAWIRATDPDPTHRNAAEAVDLAERACRLTGSKEALLLGTLAAAYAEAGRFPDAVSIAQKAIDLATANRQTDTAAANQKLIELYRAEKPFRDTNYSAMP